MAAIVGTIQMKTNTLEIMTLKWLLEAIDAQKISTKGDKG